MTTMDLRQEARSRLDALPADKLKVAAEFLAYLDERASDEATAELLKIPGLLDELREARAQTAAGKGTPFEKLRRKYRK